MFDSFIFLYSSLPIRL